MSDGNVAGDAGASETSDAAGAPEAGEPPGRYSLLRRSVGVALGSESYLLRAYAVVGTLLAVLIAVAWLLALPGWVAASLGGSGTVTFSRAFLLLTGLLVLTPLFAPTVLAARRHRDGRASRRRDAALGLGGFSFVAGLYLSLLISAPPDLRDPPRGALAPVIEALYALDPVYGVVPPVLAAVLIAVVDRI